ncbi:hypothetical protein IWQ62_004117 [Dispira parvispora]|uniref:Uncharacterized protein n=1 Tax=Dispira parvispora TaxID=1520584 RepID=A0A9W8ALJ2_9FUNG|nr:hypothetical protein IWQ62_004117 [Dispira parvispora]
MTNELINQLINAQEMIPMQRLYTRERYETPSSGKIIEEDIPHMLDFLICEIRRLEGLEPADHFGCLFGVKVWHARNLPLDNFCNVLDNQLSPSELRNQIEKFDPRMQYQLVDLNEAREY